MILSLRFNRGTLRLLTASAGLLIAAAPALFAENALPPMPTPSPEAVSAALRAGTTAPETAGAQRGPSAGAGAATSAAGNATSVSPNPNGLDSVRPAAPKVSADIVSEDRTPDAGSSGESTAEKSNPEVASSASPSPSNPSGDQVGYASWYGSRFHGRLTANGEVYDMNKLTAANKTLPFGTVVKVTNLENGKSVDVTINDRGPFVAGRIIDLSRAAAEAIGLMSMGVAKVRLHILKMGDGARVKPQMAAQAAASGSQSADGAAAAGKLPVIVQLGAFRDLGNAVRLKDFLDKNGFNPLYEKSGDVTRVVLVSVPQTELASVRARLSKIGIDSILVRHE